MPAQTLRTYQEDGVRAIFDAWRGGARSVLSVAPTGSGKTSIFCWVAQAIPARTLIVVHRRELATQAANRIREFGLDFGFELAGFPRRPWAKIQIGSVQTLIRRDAPPAGLVVFDEAHLSTAKTWVTIRDRYPDAKILGVTATPWRLSGKPLAAAYDAAVVISRPHELREAGWLCPYVGFSYKTPDLSAVKTTAGEYNEKQSAAVMGQSLIVDSIVEEWVKHARDLSTVVFAVTVEHSKQLTARFRAAGIAAEHLDGSTPQLERAAILKRVDTGRTAVLCNVGVCLDSATEILTSTGWVGANDITQDHHVANWDQGRVYFAPPNRIVRRPRAPGERMVSLEGSRINVRVTEGHELLFRTNSGQYSKKTAADLVGVRKRFPVSGVAGPLPVLTAALRPRNRPRLVAALSYMLRQQGWSPADARTEAERRTDRRLALRRKDPSELTEDECLLIGFWLGDGTRAKLQRGGVEYRLLQGTAWPVLCEWVESLLNRLGLDFVCRDVENVRIWSLPRGTGGGCQERNGLFHLETYLDKNGSDLLWGLSEPQFDAFLRGLWMADGEHGQDGRPNLKRAFRITTYNRTLADRLQAIATCRGYRATILTKRQPARSFSPGNLSYRVVCVKRRDHHSGTETLQIEQGWKAEDVWCVTTASGNIITRRNGKVLVMGNCVEGLDIPRLKCCVLARPTKSLARAIQMMGRVRRPFQGLTARIHDHAFVIKAHGLPDDEREYTLDAPDEKPPSLTQCKVCLALYRGPRCPACDTAPEPQILGEREIRTVADAEKVEFSSDTPEVHRPPVDIRWNKPGQVVEGKFLRAWDEPTQYGTLRTYLLKGSKREYRFHGTTHLNKLMSRVQIPDSALRVTYVDEIPYGDGRTFKRFKVEVDR